MSTTDSGMVLLTPGLAVGKAEPLIGGETQNWPLDPEEVPMAMWDSGVFVTELINLKLSPEKVEIAELSETQQENFQANPEVLLAVLAEGGVQAPIKEGTYRGTQLALTKMYELVETNYKSYLDAANFEPTVPTPLSIEKKREFFSFTCPNLADPSASADNFPPHLNLAANRDWSQKAESNQSAFLTPIDLFNKMRVAQLSQLLPVLIPDKFLEKGKAALGQAAATAVFGDMGRPDVGDTIKDVEAYQRKERSKHHFWQRNDIFNLPNVGDIPDWYSDERFAQQFFTGTNPTTIELASDVWIQHFLDAAQPEDVKMRAKIQKLSKEARGSLYVLDYSYFREAAGIEDPAAVISCPYDYVNDKGKKVQGIRYGVAAVCLFHLDENSGKLAPLAIVCDWRGSRQTSVTIYNQEPPRSTSDQAIDWPWRYAKTCVQTSDWLCHEITVHLTHTHLVEEATIVGAQRSFLDTHVVFQLLYPHWQKTLALNAAARATLVPHVINELVGLTKDQSTRFTLHAFNTFDFQGRYAPEDLRRRGFPPETLQDPRSRNYAWARCINSMWGKIRRYVASMLDLAYPAPHADQKVAADEYVRDWSEIMQRDPAVKDGGAGMKSFPTIRTLDQLVDAVTMCIHLASPQHTSINYLQNYYQAFVINKPPCLYTAPPTSHAALKAYTEKHLVLALPINHPKEWLLASHIPYMLSFKPGDKESLIMYANSKYHLYKLKRRNESPNAPEIAACAKEFYQDLARSEAEFKKYGQDTFDAGVITYDVLSPSWNAVSILI